MSRQHPSTCGCDWCAEAHNQAPDADSEALTAIHALLDGNEWSPDTLDAIADLVRRTGREVREVPE